MPALKKVNCLFESNLPRTKWEFSIVISIPLRVVSAREYMVNIYLKTSCHGQNGNFQS